MYRLTQNSVRAIVVALFTFSSFSGLLLSEEKEKLTERALQQLILQKCDANKDLNYANIYPALLRNFQQAGLTAEDVDKYITRTAKNRRIEEWRKRKRDAVLLEEMKGRSVLYEEPTVEKAMSNERTEAVDAAIAELPQDEQRLFLDRLCGGLTIIELARRNGVSDDVIARQLKKIYAKLAFQLQEFAPDNFKK